MGKRPPRTSFFKAFRQTLGSLLAGRRWIAGSKYFGKKRTEFLKIIV